MNSNDITQNDSLLLIPKSTQNKAAVQKIFKQKFFQQTNLHSLQKNLILSQKLNSSVKNLNFSSSKVANKNMTSQNENDGLLSNFDAQKCIPLKDKTPAMAKRR